MNALGRHILVEFIGCSSEVLNDVLQIEKGMVDAAKNAGATVINSTFHHFSPYGVSGVVVIQESHLAIHTWPEFQYAAVDLFTCGETVDPWVSFDHLKKVFQAKNHSALEMHRGSLSLMKRSEFQSQAMTEMREEVAQFTQPQIKRDIWFTDKDENQAFSLRYSKDPLFEEVSPFQKVRVLETHAYGKMLAINDMVMCTERDEAHYHEMIVHPALQLLKTPKKVLVIGGGDGGTIREIFKYPSIEEVVMVEIDEAVIRASKEFLPEIAKEFGNPKLKLIIGDGIEYVQKAAAESFDAIIVDGSDPVGPAEGLFSTEFYKNCQRTVRSGGIVVTQGESPMFHQKTFVELNQCLKGIFGASSVHTMLFFATSYPTGMWSLQMAVKGNMHPVADYSKSEAESFLSKSDMKYYNTDVHVGAFALPQFVRKLLNS